MARFPRWSLLGLLACSSDPVSPMLEEVCDGFSDTPQTWSIPGPFVYGIQMAGREGVGDYWSLYDLDGDELLDLIEHHHGSNAAAEEMGAHWYVWWNDGSGFGERTEYALPVDHRELAGLYAANSTQVILDITGDGVADLVRALDPDTNGVWGEDAEPHWRVYPGSGRDGFALEPLLWSLPEPVDHEVHSDRTGGYHWTTFDLDGDGLVELVHTASTEDAGTWGFAEGNPHWRVFANTGTGFETDFDVWPLPDMPDGRNGWFTAHTNALPNQSVRTQDVTGDGLPDLVAPREAGWPYPIWGGKADPHWRVYPNLGDRFSHDWIDWAVPDDTVLLPGDAEDWEFETSRVHDTFVNGGGMPNLVVPGAGGWSVYRNQGDGFAAEPTPWSTPDDAFDALWSTAGGVGNGWTTVDLTGDGCMDLVLTSGLDLGHPESGSTTWTWRVWPGE